MILIFDLVNSLWTVFFEVNKSITTSNIG